MDRKQTYKLSEFSKRVGVSERTLRRWDTDGKLTAMRTPTGRLYYSEEQLTAYLNRGGARPDAHDNDGRTCCIYAAGREPEFAGAAVMRSNQAFQLCAANNWTVENIYTDMHGETGQDVSRLSFFRMLGRIMDGEIGHVIMTGRTGLEDAIAFEMFQQVLEKHHVRLTVVSEHTAREITQKGE